MTHKTKTFLVISLKNQAVIADKCNVAESFFSRLFGLMGRTRFEAGEGILFPHCNNIHMWFMRISIDVIFLERLPGAQPKWKISSMRVGAPPWRLVPFFDGGATDTLELPKGSAARCGLEVGDEVCIG